MPVSGIERFFHNVSVFTIKEAEFWHLFFVGSRAKLGGTYEQICANYIKLMPQMVASALPISSGGGN